MDPIAFFQLLWQLISRTNSLLSLVQRLAALWSQIKTKMGPNPNGTPSNNPERPKYQPELHVPSNHSCPQSGDYHIIGKRETKKYFSKGSKMPMYQGENFEVSVTWVFYPPEDALLETLDINNPPADYPPRNDLLFEILAPLRDTLRTGQKPLDFADLHSRHTYVQILFYLNLCIDKKYIIGKFHPRAKYMTFKITEEGQTLLNILEATIPHLKSQKTHDLRS